MAFLPFPISLLSTNHQSASRPSNTTQHKQIWPYHSYLRFQTGKRWPQDEEGMPQNRQNMPAPSSLLTGLLRLHMRRATSRGCKHPPWAAACRGCSTALRSDGGAADLKLVPDLSVQPLLEHGCLGTDLPARLPCRGSFRPCPCNKQPPEVDLIEAGAWSFPAASTSHLSASP